MKVLHVYRTYFPDPPGGLQEAIRQICLSTQRHGVENTVFTLSPSPVPRVLERPEARVIRHRSWAAPASCDLGDPSAFGVFRKLAREADVVHYLFPWPFADLLHHLANPGTPAVLTYVSDIVRQRWLGRLYSPLMHKTLADMRWIVANAPAYAQTSPVLATPEVTRKLRIIPLGICGDSGPTEQDDGVLNAHGLDTGAPFVLFLGVLRYYKGLHTLIEAAASVQGRIVIAGEGPGGPALREQVKRLGLENVRFTGALSEAGKRSLLKHCRALVLPSHLRSEAYGMVLVEAAMFGKPMISCEIGTGTSFVNRDGETGFVVPAEDPTALAGAMNRLLADAAEAQRLGLAARERYARLFSGEALGAAYAGLFRDAV